MSRRRGKGGLNSRNPAVVHAHDLSEEVVLGNHDDLKHLDSLLVEWYDQEDHDWRGGLFFPHCFHFVPFATVCIFQEEEEWSLFHVIAVTSLAHKVVSSFFPHRVLSD